MRFGGGFSGIRTGGMGLEVPSPARWSASLLPLIPLWPLTHFRIVFPGHHLSQAMMHLKILPCWVSVQSRASHFLRCFVSPLMAYLELLMIVRATLPSALNVINASSVGKLVQLVTASRLTLYHEGRFDPMKDECHYQVKH